MTEKRFTIKEMQTWNKRYRLDKEDTTKVIDTTMEDAEFWTVHKNEAYNLCNELNRLEEENEQLKQDNDNLIHLLENQSIIIQELHSKLMNYQLKEPIVLTKEDLEVMGKAISYYSH